MNGNLLGGVLLILIFFSLLGACEGQETEDIVTIVDGTGELVDVSLPVEKIVSITSRASEIVYALGSGDKIVGRDSYSFYPSSLEGVPVVARSSRSPNVELIHKIDPDLVIADSMLSEEDRRKIESAGIEIGYPYSTMASATTFHNLTVAAGGINIAADQPVDYPTVDPEWVVERDPDIIFSYATNTADENLTDKMKEIHDEIISWPELVDVKAVKNDQVYILGNPVAWGISSVVGDLYLAKWFHPDLFEDIDPEAVHREFLLKFFGEQLTEKSVYP